MLTMICPKLPMRDKAATRAFYVDGLGFQDIGRADFHDYLILARDGLEVHFFRHTTLNPLENYGQLYLRTENIHALNTLALAHNLTFSSGGHLEAKPWGQLEFSLIDPDYNLLTFGQTAG